MIDPFYLQNSTPRFSKKYRRNENQKNTAKALRTKKRRAKNKIARKSRKFNLINK